MTVTEENIIELLKSLVETPSYSKEEKVAAKVIRDFLKQHKIAFETIQNNTWCKNKHFDALKPTILLNSHIDTVKPVSTWKKNPHKATSTKEKLYGLGTNDAGAALVCLLGTFINFYDKEDLKYNLIFAATAEEEISGANGLILLEELTKTCDFAIVGEPTELKLALAEKGLMVVDAVVKGKSGHAARNEGVNAIYKTMTDLDWIQNYQFKKINSLLGPIKMTVTQINAGTQHNVVPDTCNFVIDIRSIPEYTHEQILEILTNNLKAELKPRSTRLNPSFIEEDHPIALAADKLGIEKFGSSTLSDQALLKIPSVKIGPGKSERSHTADEYIEFAEIKQGLKIYTKLLEQLL